MHPNQQMHVCRDHANLENVGAFLTGNATQETAQETSQSAIYKVLAFACRPDDVIVETVPHRLKLPETRPVDRIGSTREGAYYCDTRRIRGRCRAAASAAQSTSISTTLLPPRPPASSEAPTRP